MAASCSGFRAMSFSFCERSFDVSRTENSKTPSNASSDSVISILILNYAWKKNFWCHYCFPFVGERSSVKCLRLTAGDLFSPHLLPLLARPLPTFPQFFAHPRRTPSLAHFFTRWFDLRLEKERKRLLRRLLYVWKSKLKRQLVTLKKWSANA